MLSAIKKHYFVVLVVCLMLLHVGVIVFLAGAYAPFGLEIPMQIFPADLCVCVFALKGVDR